MSWTEFKKKKCGLNLHGSLNNWSYIPKSLFDDVVANTFLANGSDDGISAESDLEVVEFSWVGERRKAKELEKLFTE